MRLFVGVRPAEEAVADLDAFLDVRRAAAAFRWSLPEQFHFTLAFCENAPQRKLDDLIDRLERAAAKRTAFSATITGGGAFPHANRAKVLWAGLETDQTGAVELPRLATGARAAANRAGMAVDGSRFKAHLTVARLRFPDEVSHWVRLLDAYRGPTFEVAEIELIQSHLGEGPRRRPRYQTLASFSLSR